MKIVGGQEPWAEINLEDGVTLRVRIAIGGVLKYEDKGPDGLNRYDINAHMQTTVHRTEAEKTEAEKIEIAIAPFKDSLNEKQFAWLGERVGDAVRAIKARAA